jgi:hypothetical protein
MGLRSLAVGRELPHACERAGSPFHVACSAEAARSNGIAAAEGVFRDGCALMRNNPPRAIARNCAKNATFRVREKCEKRLKTRGRPFCKSRRVAFMRIAPNGPNWVRHSRNRRKTGAQWSRTVPLSGRRRSEMEIGHGSYQRGSLDSLNFGAIFNYHPASDNSVKPVRQILEHHLVGRAAAVANLLHERRWDSRQMGTRW